MASRSSHIAVGVALYLALVMSIYGLHLVAFPRGGGVIPLWYASLETLLEAATAVFPGALVGWLSRQNGLRLGAITGAVGAVVAYSVQFISWGLPPFGEPLLSIATSIAVVAFAAAVTNAIGGIAGVSYRNQAKPSNLPLNPDAPKSGAPVS